MTRQVIASSVVSAVIGATVAAVALTLTQERPAVTRDDAGVLDMESRLRALESMRRDASPVAPAQTAREPAVDLRVLVAEEVDRWLSVRFAGREGDPDGASRDEGLQELLALDPASDEARALLDALRKGGALEDVIERLQELAALDPGNPTLQFLLAQSYVEQIMAGVDGQTASELAELADAAYDHALAADPGYWDARYAKAVGLTYWPPEKGKQGEAVEQFKALIDQQQGLPSTPQFADVHYHLGAMYLELGQTEEAIAAFQAGLAKFPDHPGMLQQLASLGG